MPMKAPFLLIASFICIFFVTLSCNKKDSAPPISSSTNIAIDTFLLRQADNGFLFETDTFGIIGPDTIKMTLPGGTNLAQLAPTIGFKGKTLFPASGVVQDFTNPIKYTVTDDNGNTKSYVVKMSLTSSNQLFVNADRIFALDLGKGTARWINQANYSASIVSNDVSQNGVVYTGNSNGFFTAIDALTGKTRWSQKLANSYFYSPAIANGTVYSGCGDGSVYAIDTATGSLKWAINLGATYGVFSAPIIANAVIYIQCNGNLFALNMVNGNIIWKSSAVVNFHCGLALSAGAAYIAGSDSSFISINTTTGATNWKIKTGYITTTAAVVNNTIYVGSMADSLYAINATTGNKVWTSFVNRGPSNQYVAYPGIQSNALVINGTVYIGGGDPNLYAFDAATGTLKWICNLSNEVTASPAFVDGVVYAGNLDGNIYAVDASSGKIKWMQWVGNTNNKMLSPCIVSKNGTVYNP